MAVKKAKKVAAKTAGTEVLSKPKAAAAPTKTKRAPKAAASAAAAPVTYIVIDHPTEGELISGLHYAIRVGASEGAGVELSFDDGEWLAARFAAGYWWFDWGYFPPGIHKIVARLIDHSGKLIKKSTVRKVEII